MHTASFQLNDFGKKYMNTIIYFRYLYFQVSLSLSMAVALSFYISPKRFYSGGLSGHTEPLLKLLQILDNVLWEFYTSPLHPIQGKWTRLPIAEPIFSALLHCKVQRHYTESSKNIPRKETARLQCQLLHSFSFAWAIYIFPGSVRLSCCRKIDGLIVGIYKSLSDLWKWKLGLKPHGLISGNTKSDILCSVGLHCGESLCPLRNNQDQNSRRLCVRWKDTFSAEKSPFRSIADIWAFIKYLYCEMTAWPSFFVQVCCPCSVCFWFHCAWAVGMGAKGTFSAIVEELWWKAGLQKGNFSTTFRPMSKESASEVGSFWTLTKRW